MLDNLETKAIEAALDVLLKQVAEELRKKPFWWRPRVGRIVRTVGAKLDDLILDLQPCFAFGGYIHPAADGRLRTCATSAEA